MSVASKRVANPVLFTLGHFCWDLLSFQKAIVLRHLAFQARANNASFKDVAFGQESADTGLRSGSTTD